MSENNLKLEAKNTARKLRHNQTKAEKHLWEYLRNRNFYNIKFLRQHQIIFVYLNKKHFYTDNCSNCQYIP